MPVIPFWATIVGASASGASAAAASAIASGAAGIGAAAAGTAVGATAAGIGAGAIAAGAAAAAGGIGAALASGAAGAGASTLIGSLTQPKTKMPGMPSLTDTPEAKDMSVETAAQQAAQLLKNKKRAVASSRTVYTSPLGETDEADIMVKTLLGK